MADEPENETPEAPVAPTAEEGAAEAPASAAAESPAASEPVEQLPPKERRRKARSTHSGRPREARSPEERHAERLAERRQKAVRRRARRLQERAKRATARESAGPASTPPAPVAEEGARKVRQGIVVSDKADKTITVRIDVARRHRRYEKIVRSSNTLHAHDESNEAHEGDVVRVIESRPLSRTKRWRLVDVLERAR
jgi:small subunit ribosomal protein S17